MPRETVTTRRTEEAGPSRPPCADCGDNESTIYFERDGEWACDEPSLCIERQRDQATAQLALAIDALESVVSYAYGASGATGDDAGHLTAVGMMAVEALAALRER